MFNKIESSKQFIFYTVYFKLSDHKYYYFSVCDYPELLSPVTTKYPQVPPSRPTQKTNVATTNSQIALQLTEIVFALI